ncbi:MULTISPECIES: hypothetical protein [Actinoplanes]|uniref:hypothetical protein n=1 Tax=Actinoplanes TaxID=1865 RepID=UPI0009F819E9|nr:MULTISPECIES: hypothetical protein [Actinoplanes]GLY01842.1 hypothetical protein Acsp01_22210 [Actinoplanes sp. NBRC 101535]
MADLGELRSIVIRRARLDAAELESIDRARRDGATWSEIAEALGLASRQAAEQRRLRLARSAERDSRPDRERLDRGYGARVAGLRRRVVEVNRRIGADRRWDGRFPRAELVRETLAAAPDAPAGALHDLVEAVLSDVAAPEVPRFPAPLQASWDGLRESFTEL